MLFNLQVCSLSLKLKLKYVCIEMATRSVIDVRSLTLPDPTIAIFLVLCVKHNDV